MIKNNSRKSRKMRYIESFQTLCRKDKYSDTVGNFYYNIFGNYTSLKNLKEDVKMLESIDELGRSIKELDELIIEKFSNELRPIDYRYDTIEHFGLDWFRRAANNIANDIKRRYEGIKNGLVSQGNNFYNSTVNAAKNSANSLKNEATNIYNQAQKWATDKINAGLKLYDQYLSDSINNMINQVKDVGNQIRDGATNAYNQANNTVNTVKNGAVSSFNSVKDTANNTMNQIESGVNSSLNTIESGFNSTINTMESGFNDTIDTIESGATSAMDTIADGTMGVFDQMESGVMGVFDQAKNGLNEALDFVRDLPNQIPLPKSSSRKNVKSGMEEPNEEKKLQDVPAISGTDIDISKVNAAAKEAGINTDPTGTEEVEIDTSYKPMDDDKFDPSVHTGEKIGDLKYVGKYDLTHHRSDITPEGIKYSELNIFFALEKDGPKIKENANNIDHFIIPSVTGNKIYKCKILQHGTYTQWLEFNLRQKDSGEPVDKDFIKINTPVIVHAYKTIESTETFGNLCYDKPNTNEELSDKYVVLLAIFIILLLAYLLIDNNS